MQLQDIKQGVLAQLEQDKEYILRQDDPSDTLYEIIDVNMPKDSKQLLELARHDTWLATKEPKGRAFSGDNTAPNRVAWNVINELRSLQNDWLAKRRV